MRQIKTITLPSNGVTKTEKEVTIQEMYGKEVSALYSNFNEESVDYVLSRVIVEPKDFDLKRITAEDKTYILHALRVLTYGKEIEQTLKCQFCGQTHDYLINYDDFELVKLDPEHLTKDAVVEIGGTTYSRKVPTLKDRDNIAKFKETMKIQDHDSYILLLMTYIDTVDNVAMTEYALWEHLTNIPARYLVEIEKHTNYKMGLDTTYQVECESCNMPITGGIGLNANIFR